MRVEVNNLVYDSEKKDCYLEVVQAQSMLFAFVQCLDVGFDGTLKAVKRYWGSYSHEEPEKSIELILKFGGKWPKLPSEPKSYFA